MTMVLIAAHMLGDYVFQNNWMIQRNMRMA